MRTKALALALGALLTVVSAGCGSGDDAGAAPENTTGTEMAASVAPTDAATTTAPTIEITARDYGFDIPSTIPGGLVDMALVNTGKEPHYAAFARPVGDKTLADVRAALTTPPAAAPPGPPPMLEYAALGTVSPGGTSRLTIKLPAGPYVLFCAFPAPDGKPHNELGMMVDVEVTGGNDAMLPATPATVPTFDFAFGNFPELKAGRNRITLENRGKQMHEIDLVELADGKTIEDAKVWAATLQGPAPIRFLGGPAVNVGLSAVGTFDLKPGVRYAFVCIVPDTLGDWVPHLAKGMHSDTFEVPPA